VSEPRPGRAGEPEPDWVPDVSGWSDADFWAMARRVRQTAEEELAEVEWETERAELKREDLAARSLRAMMEGERWQLSAGARVVEGQVVHVGLDFTAVADRAGNRHDIAHRAVELIRVVAVEPGSGRAPASLRPATLRARLLDLERVEVVKGPQSALYGRNAFAGAINYITKKPSMDGLRINVSADDVANYSIYDVRGSISGPVIADRLALSKRTVDKHRENLLLKTQSKNTANLVIFAIKNGLLQI